VLEENEFEEIKPEDILYAHVQEENIIYEFQNQYKCQYIHHVITTSKISEEKVAYKTTSK